MLTKKLELVRRIEAMGYVLDYSSSRGTLFVLHNGCTGKILINNNNGVCFYGVDGHDDYLECKASDLFLT